MHLPAFCCSLVQGVLWECFSGDGLDYWHAVLDSENQEAMFKMPSHHLGIKGLRSYRLRQEQDSLPRLVLPVHSKPAIRLALLSSIPTVLPLGAPPCLIGPQCGAKAGTQGFMYTGLELK